MEIDGYSYLQYGLGTVLFSLAFLIVIGALAIMINIIKDGR